MFPNVRLMIAATLASVVVLICGFGMFAAFRVSHEPLARLPPAGAPMQLVADSVVKSSRAFTPGESFDRRFQISASPSASETASPSAHGIDQHNNADVTSGTLPTVPELHAAAPEDTRPPAEPKGQAQASLPDQAAPAESAAALTADQQPHIPSTPEPESAPRAGPIAMIDPPAAASADAEHQPPAAGGFEPPPSELELSATVVTAVPPPEQRPPLIDPAPASETAPPIVPAKKAEDKAAKPKAKRVAIKIRRGPALANASFGSQSFKQNSTFNQTNFLGAPPAQAQFVEKRPFRLRRSKIAAARTKDLASTKAKEAASERLKEASSGKEVTSEKAKDAASEKVKEAASERAKGVAPEKAQEAVSEKLKDVVPEKVQEAVSAKEVVSDRTRDSEAGIGGPFVSPPNQ